jgi:hypothetical protein
MWIVLLLVVAGSVHEQRASDHGFSLPAWRDILAQHDDDANKAAGVELPRRRSALHSLLRSYSDSGSGFVHSARSTSTVRVIHVLW